MSDSLYELILARVGFIEEDLPTAEGSMQNDLADERAQAVLRFIELAAGSPLPNKLLPSEESR